MTVSRIPFVLLALASLTAAANAAPTIITTLDGTQGAIGPVSNQSAGWAAYGFSGGGSAGFGVLPTGDATGSLLMSGDRSRVGVGLFEGVNVAEGTVPSFGTLGALASGTMFADLYRDASSMTNSSVYNVAVKLLFANNESLTWENANNGSNATTDAFFNVSLSGTDGDWYVRTGGVSYDTPSQNLTLGAWASGQKAGVTFNGFNQNSQVLGILLAVGSGISSNGGTFVGGFDHLQANFTGGTSYSYDFKDSRVMSSVPGPAAFVPFALGFARRLRRRKLA